MGNVNEVINVSSARSNLTKTVEGMRMDPEHARPVIFGAHRKAEAVIVPYDQYARLVLGHKGSPTPAPSTAPLLEELTDKKHLIRRLAEASSIGHVRVFGSVARGEETDASDIDLLADTSPGASYFDLAQFAMDVEAVIGRRVDVVPLSALDPERDRAILDEAITL